MSISAAEMIPKNLNVFCVVSKQLEMQEETQIDFKELRTKAALKAAKLVSDLLSWIQLMKSYPQREDDLVTVNATFREITTARCRFGDDDAWVNLCDAITTMSEELIDKFERKRHIVFSEKDFQFVKGSCDCLLKTFGPTGKRSGYPYLPLESC